jgi:methylated-DNA-protein-cysteine methyltransferase-like protein
MDRIARTRRILDIVREIPEGRVASYGQVAELAGIPRGARQVGRALGSQPDGDDVPWHRVIQASGRIAFPEGSAQYDEQSRLLRMENVAIVAGRIDMRQFRWQPDLDELLWKPTPAWDEE